MYPFPNQNLDPYFGMGTGYVGRRPVTKPKPTTIENQYRLAEEGTKQNVEDYSWLAQAYKDLFNQSPGAARNAFQTEDVRYQPSADYKSSFVNLQGLSKSGGYTPEELAALRERGISPIRSIYAGAMRDVDRQRALQGGYSPNYNAVRAKMARELSDRISSGMNDVNAGIAERVAQNRLSVAPQLVSAASGQSNLANEMRSSGARNREAANRAAFEAEQGARERALAGATSLYGTTPALSSTFTNQALNSAQLQNQINQGNNQFDMNAYNSMVRSLPPMASRTVRPGYNTSGLRSIYG